MNKSQAQLILEALVAGETITPLDALNRWGCFRLGARIADLRAQGHDIENLEKTGTHARYHLRRSIPKLPPAFKPVEKQQIPML